MIADHISTSCTRNAVQEGFYASTHIHPYPLHISARSWVQHIKIDALPLCHVLEMNSPSPQTSNLDYSDYPDGYGPIHG